MLVVPRFRVEPAEETAFLADAEGALAALAARPGYLEGSIGRATDDPTLWVISMRWEGVGAYRRALSAYDVKVATVPLLSRAIDEPTAYEVVHGDGATEPNRAEPRGSAPGSLGPGWGDSA
ncbi:MAG TPA: antibiotic biosynthesis monooxygenase [Nocardioidaceae bacterium]|nr:antibiotic biosynthesis monooxygenase [Nocardioidaceae bacterium]